MRIRSMRPDECDGVRFANRGPGLATIDLRASPGRLFRPATRRVAPEASVHGFIRSKRVVGIASVHKACVIAVV